MNDYDRFGDFDYDRKRCPNCYEEYDESTQDWKCPHEDKKSIYDGIFSNKETKETKMKFHYSKDGKRTACGLVVGIDNIKTTDDVKHEDMCGNCNRTMKFKYSKPVDKVTETTMFNNYKKYNNVDTDTHCKYPNLKKAILEHKDMKIAVNPEQYVEVQKIAFECGVFWATGEKYPIKDTTKRGIFLTHSVYVHAYVITHSDAKFFNLSGTQEYSLEHDCFVSDIPDIPVYVKEVKDNKTIVTTTITPSVSLVKQEDGTWKQFKNTACVSNKRLEAITELSEEDWNFIVIMIKGELANPCEDCWKNLIDYFNIYGSDTVKRVHDKHWYMLFTLIKSTHDAGGTWDWMLKSFTVLTVKELISNLGTNGIEFIATRTTNYDEKLPEVNI